MNDYIQPDFYRFNEDSLKLVNWIADLRPHCASLLDLGAGSGVIGIELANRLKIPDLTLLEVQNDFLPVLQQNILEQLKSETRTTVIHSSFGEWLPDNEFDLIVCNPPYYLKGHGEASKDERKQIARSFVIDDWKILMGKVEKALSPRGRAFFVVKNDQRILKDIKAATKLKLNVHEKGDILFIELSRLNVD